MSSSARRAGAWGAAALVLLPAAVGAQSVALGWEAPPGCPDRAALLTRLPTAPRPLSASARVTRRADGRWAMHLDIDDGAVRGERDLLADTCAELADAAVLILALTLDGAPAATPGPPPRPAPPPPPARREGVRWSVRAMGGVDLGTMPSASPVASLSFAAGRSWWRLEASASWLPSQRVALPSGAGGDFDAGRVTLRGCVVPIARRVELRGCAGFDLGLIAGAGFGVPDPDHGSAFWWGARAGAEVAWRATRRVSLAVAADGVALIDRPTFALHDGTELHTPSRWGALAQAGAEVSW